MESGCLLGASRWKFTWHTQPGGDPGVDPEVAGEIYISLAWETSESPRKSWKAWLWRGMSGMSYFDGYLCDLNLDKRKMMEKLNDACFCKLLLKQLTMWHQL